MKKLIVAAILGTVAVLGSASIAAGTGDLVNVGGVNVDLHGLNNAGRMQVHIHNIVHNVQILNDGTLTFDIGNL